MSPVDLRARYALTSSASGHTLHALTVLGPCTVKAAAAACGIRVAAAYQRIRRARKPTLLHRGMGPPGRG